MIGHLQTEVGAWQRRFDTPDPVLKALKFAEEAGEVAEAVVNLQESGGSLAEVADEVGDAIITLAGLADAVGLELDAAVAERTVPAEETREPVLGALRFAARAGQVAGATVKMREGRKTLSDLAASMGVAVVTLEGVAAAVGVELDAAVSDRWVEIRERRYARATSHPGGVAPWGPT